MEGRLKLDSWQGKETGEKRSKLIVVGENIQFIGSKPGGGERAETQASTPTPAGPAHPQEVEEDDIPF